MDDRKESVMRFELDIDYPLEQMERNRKRMEARGSYQYTDRVPVGFCVVPRYFTPIFKIPYNTIFKNVTEHYHWQLQFLKYRIEHIPEDMICHGPSLWVGPYFDNVLDSAAFGAEIEWPENETLHSRPVITSVEQMERYPMPEPGTGLWKQAIEWSLEMREFAKNTRLTFRGVEGKVNVGSPNISGLSPHMIAIDLVGVEFYCWQAEYPEACHRFLNRITDTLIEAQRYFLKLQNQTFNGFGWMAEDTATVMSPAMFKEFCIPYSTRIFGNSSIRSVHMCGPSTHLHQALVEDMKMTSFDLFGYMVEPEVAARNLGGKSLMWGNINPMLMLNGTKEEVKQAARHVLEAIAPCGGLMLGDGANVCPGTPLANLAALTEAAEEYGLPPTPRR
jgi:uroporphyrinogen-III decarboxylase